MTRIDTHSRMTDAAAQADGTLRTRLLGGAASIGVALALLVPAGAQAQSVDACGPVTDGHVTCTPAGNPFPDGIFYAAPGNGGVAGAPVLDLEIALESGVAVQLDPGAAFDVGVAAYGLNGGSVTITGANGTSISTTRPGHYGALALGRGGGDLSIALDRVDTAGIGIENLVFDGGSSSISVNDLRTSGDDSHGIFSNGRSLTRPTATTIEAGTIVTTGDFADAIRVIDRASGTVSITSTGSIVTSGEHAYGVKVFGTGAGTVADVWLNDVTVSGIYTVGVAVAGRDVTLQIDGTVKTTGESATAVAIGNNFRPATPPKLILNGAIETIGDRSTGLSMEAGYGLIVSGRGTIDTVGQSSGAIHATTVFQHGDAVIDLSRISTRGDNAAGIYFTALFGGVGNLDVTVDDLLTEGDGAFGIRADSADNATFRSSGTVSTLGDDASAIALVARGGAANIFVNTVSTAGNDVNTVSARGQSATVTISGAASSAGTAYSSAYIHANATVYARAYADLAPGSENDPLNGIATVINNGAVSSLADDVRGIAAIGDNGVVISGTGSVTTSGADATGIFAQSGGNIVVAQSNVVTNGAARGVFAETLGADGTIDIQIGAVETRSIDAGGTAPTAITTIARNGSTTIRAGAISTAAEGAQGVNATSDQGDVLIDIGTVRTTGAYAAGIVTQDGSGAKSVRAQSIVTTGEASTGVSAWSGGGPVSVAVGDVTTSGAYATGVSARSFYGAGAGVTSTGTIATSGLGATGVSVGASYGLASASVNNVRATGGEAAAIRVSGAAARVAISGEVISTGAGFGTAYPAAVSATADTPSGLTEPAGIGTAVVLNNGSVIASGDGNRGIFVSGTNAATISGTGSASSNGSGSRALSVASGDGNVSITQASATAAGVGNVIGVVGASYGATGNVTIDVGRVTVTQTDGESQGIFSTVRGGTLAVTAGTVTTSGAGANGIVATSTEGGLVTVTAGTVSTSGDDSEGIHAGDGASQVTVTATRVNTSGDRATAIDAVVDSGVVTVRAVDASTNGFHSFGVSAVSQSGGTASVTQTGSVTTSGDEGFGVQSTVLDRTGSATTVAHDVSTSGAGARAVVAVAGTASVTVTGAVRTSGAASAGITAGGYQGNAAVLNSGTVRTTGAASEGIYARAAGNVTVSGTGSVATTGAGATGILAESLGGTVSVRQGAVSTTGANATGVTARAGEGNVVLDLATVTSTGAGSTAVFAQAAGTVTASVAAGATVSGTAAALTVLSGGGTLLTNAGTVDGAGQAITIAGGPARIANSGTIAGALTLSGQADTLTNSGQLRLSAASFGAGDDVLVNSGTTTLAGNLDFGAGSDLFTNGGTLDFAARTVPAPRTLAGLERFANSGRIALDNGIAGDTLTLPGAFAGSGSSILALDASLAAALADRLVVGGAATGSTAIQLNLTGNAVFNTGLTLVQGGAGTSAGAFTLAPADCGLVGYGLAFDASNNRFNLVGAPSAAAVRLLKASEGAQAAWQSSADAVFAQLDAGRYAAAAGQPAMGRFWFQMFGKVARRSENAIASDFGFDRAVNLSAQQDAFGGQAGLGFGSGALTFGVTGGALTSNLSFAAAPQRIHYAAYNIGGYASLNAGNFYLNALGKYDFYEIRMRIPGIGAQKTDGNGYGVRVEGGFRLGSDGFFAEPHAGLAYVRTDLDAMAVQGVAVAFQDMTGLRGSAGLTLGGRTPLGADRVLTYYASGDVVREFEGKQGVAFATGSTVYGYRNDPLGTYGRGRIGFTIGAGPVTGFIEGEGVYGNDYKGGGGRVGLRLRF